MDSFNKYSLGIYNKPSGGLAGVMTAVYRDNPFYQENFNLEARGLSMTTTKGWKGSTHQPTTKACPVPGALVVKSEFTGFSTLCLCEGKANPTPGKGAHPGALAEDQPSS